MYANEAVSLFMIACRSFSAGAEYEPWLHGDFETTLAFQSRVSRRN